MEMRFKNSRSRLKRARLHRNAFQSEWVSLFEGKRSTALIRDEKYPGWWTLRFVFSSEATEKMLSNQLSLELGEFAYQLRAALDGLIWDTIAYTQGSEPPSDAKGLSRLEFPLSPEWKVKAEDNCFNGFPFPQKLIDWMRSIHITSTPKPLDHPDRGLETTLQDINNLARFDRHRRLRVVTMVPLANNRITLSGTLPPGGGIVDHEWLSCNPLDGEHDVARIKVVGLGGLIPYEVNLKPNLAFTVLAEDVKHYGGSDIGDELDRFISAVGHVIDRFDKELS